MLVRGSVHHTESILPVRKGIVKKNCTNSWSILLIITPFHQISRIDKDSSPW